MPTIENPFRKARLAAGLAVHPWAARLDCSPTLIQQAEAGALGRPRKLLVALEALGYNGDAMLAAYEDFKKSLRQTAVEQVGA